MDTLWNQKHKKSPVIDAILNANAPLWTILPPLAWPLATANGLQRAHSWEGSEATRQMGAKLKCTMEDAETQLLETLVQTSLFATKEHTVGEEKEADGCPSAVHHGSSRVTRNTNTTLETLTTRVL